MGNWPQTIPQGAARDVIIVRHNSTQSEQKRHHSVDNLPPDRLSVEPPFTHVGVDVFGPWMISARRTRSGHAESKGWAVLFTCLSTRAIHLEVIESTDSSYFINALRRFMAIRAPFKQIRSDQETNFIGACKDLGMSSNIDKDVVKRYLSEKACNWTFNPPHSSHMGEALGGNNR